MKKVLFFLKVPPPVHGSTLMNQRVLNSLTLRESFQCTFFPVSISKNMSDIGKFSFKKVTSVLSSYGKLYRDLRKNKPDLVYFALSPYGAAFIKDFVFTRIIASFGIPIVFHLHGRGIDEQGKRSRVFHALYKRLFRDNDAICLSKELTSDVKAYVKDPYIIPNGIQPVNFSNTAHVKKDGPYRITYLSNLIRTKGILELIAALETVRKKGATFTLSIIGKSGDVTEEEIKDTLATKGLSNQLVHLGPLYDEEKQAHLLASDLLVFPTRYKNEALPLVILEAMQCGLPVISTHEGGIPSLIEEGRTGFLVNGNINELPEKIQFLINNPEKSKAMGVAGKEKYERHYTLEVFEKNLVRVLNEILNRNSVITP